jgi:hypothetical protein
MEQPEEIINKVANSGLVSLDLEDFYDHHKKLIFDIAPFLWQGIALKEKDFREALKEYDWAQFQNAYVGIICSADAIIPTWAYMLIASKLQNISKNVVFGDLEQVEAAVYREIIKNIDLDEYVGKKVVVKGCGKLGVPTDAYIQITEKLLPIVASLMFGEPCSTVPVFKKK